MAVTIVPIAMKKAGLEGVSLYSLTAYSCERATQPRGTHPCSKIWDDAMADVLGEPKRCPERMLANVWK
jgi:hypothetical protein